MQVAVVGCGKISQTHISAIQEITDLEIIAVCDRDKDRAKWAASLTQGARVYHDLTSLLQHERPDAVHILTPPESHAGLAIQAMEAGCHVLVEKPMALNLQQADTMLAAARKHRVKLGTSHNYHFKPSISKAKQLVDQGVIGDIVYVETFYGDGNDYTSVAGRAHWAWRLPGSAFTNFLPHTIYLQLAFLKEIEAVVGVSIQEAKIPAHLATELAILVEGPTASGIITISMRAKPYLKFVNIYGTKGIIHADLVREVCILQREMRLPRLISKVLFNIDVSVQLLAGTVVSTVNFLTGTLKNNAGIDGLIRDFYRAIQSDCEPQVSGEDGRRMVAVLEMIEAQSRRYWARPAMSAVSTAPVGPKTDAEHRMVKGNLPGKVLVTGATGFLGSYLVSALARCGVEVLTFVRDKDRVSTQLAKEARIVCGDVRDPAALEKAMRDVAVVYHCAALTSNQFPWTLHHEINVLGTQNVCQAARTAGVPRLIHLSSVIVYGVDKPGHDGMLNEETTCTKNPDKWAYYLRSKLAAEQCVLKFRDEFGLPVTILRLGILYGPGGRGGVGEGLMKVGPFRLTIGAQYNFLPFTYIDNAIDCLLLAAMSPHAVGQIYNVVDEPQVRMRDITRQSADITGERTILVPVPPMLLMTVARILELRSTLRHAELPPRLSRFIIRSTCRNLRYASDKARQQLGWQSAVTLKEGLQRTFDHSA